MKTILLLTMILVTTSLTSQDYHPLLRANHRWTTTVTHDMGDQNTILIYAYKNDTVINDVTYKSMGNKVFLREDTVEKKVYKFLENKSPSECLLYDFSANVGDKLSDGINEITIDSISTILLSNNEERKVFYFFSRWDKYIEGIGSTTSLEYLADAFAGPSMALSCFETNGNGIFGENCITVSEDKISINVKEIEIINENSYNNYYIKSSIEVARIQIYDLKGSLVKDLKLQDKRFSLRNINTGIYLIRMFDNDHKFLDNRKITVRK